ncbi:hypothetical protein IWX64_003117 [Arthrobacter sp. CAN_A212]
MMTTANRSEADLDLIEEEGIGRLVLKSTRD